MTPSPAVLFYPKPLRALGLIRHTMYSESHLHTRTCRYRVQGPVWTPGATGVSRTRDGGGVWELRCTYTPSIHTLQSPPGRSERPSAVQISFQPPGHGLPTHHVTSSKPTKERPPKDTLKHSFHNGYLVSSRRDLDFTSKAPQGVPSPVNPPAETKRLRKAH